MLYTIKEAAELLKIKPSTLRTYCREGRIPHVRFGRDYRISQGTIDGITAGEIDTRKKKKGR